MTPFMGALSGGSMGAGVGGMFGGDTQSLGSGMSMARSFMPQSQSVYGGGGGLSMEQLIALIRSGVIT